MSARFHGRLAARERVAYEAFWGDPPSELFRRWLSSGGLPPSRRRGPGSLAPRQRPSPTRSPSKTSPPAPVSISSCRTRLRRRGTRSRRWSAASPIFDYNGDGKPDIYFVNGARQPQLDKPDPSFYNRLYRNNGDGSFTDVTLAAGVRGDGFATGVSAGDFDNDGWEDLFIAGVNRNHAVSQSR